MVRRVVTNIIDIYETSLVWLGADPIAKILDENNEPINVERSAIVGREAYDADPLRRLYDKKKSEGQYFVADNNFTKQNTIDLTKHVFENFSKSGNYNTDEMKNEVTLKVAELLGKKPEEVTLADLNGFIKVDDAAAAKVKIDGYDTIKGELATAKTDNDTLKLAATADKATIEKYTKIVAVDKLDELETNVGLASVVKMAEYGKTTLKGKRDEAVRLYKIAVKEADQSAAVIKTMEEGDDATVDGFLKQYGAAAYSEFGATCTKCGTGENISLRSSKPEDETTKKTGDDHMVNSMM